VLKMLVERVEAGSTIRRTERKSASAVDEAGLPSLDGFQAPRRPDRQRPNDRVVLGDLQQPCVAAGRVDANR